MKQLLTDTQIEFVIDVAEGKYTVKELCERHDISPRTVSRWKNKFSEEISMTLTVMALRGEFDPDEEEESFEGQDNNPTNFFYTFTLTRSSLTVDREDVDSGEIITRHCDRQSGLYKNFMDDLSYDPTDEVLQELLTNLFDSLRPADKINNITMDRIHIDVDTHKITFNSNGKDYEIHNSLSDKILEKCLVDEKPESLILFLDNMLDNPSNRSVENLYDFLVHNDIEITDDGHFTAWKVVRSNYYDKHSNTMDNSPGKVVSMPRSLVNENPEETCSTGLHACSKGYIQHFKGQGDRIVKVKINPKDVVSVPVDYNFQKLRCSEYLVLEDVTDSPIWY